MLGSSGWEPPRQEWPQAGRGTTGDAVGSFQLPVSRELTGQDEQTALLSPTLPWRYWFGSGEGWDRCVSLDLSPAPGPSRQEAKSR